MKKRVTSPNRITKPEQLITPISVNEEGTDSNPHHLQPATSSHPQKSAMQCLDHQEGAHAINGMEATSCLDGRSTKDSSKLQSEQSEMGEVKLSDELKPLVERALKRSGLPYPAFVKHLTQSAFKGIPVWSKSDLWRLLTMAERHDLDPLSREVFMMQSSLDPLAPLLVVVGVDGWSRLINAHEQFDGMAFIESPELDQNLPAWVECTIHRKDRRVPLSVREYMCEARGEHLSWLTHPRRMLRHKALIQCARLAFGLSGVYDAEEAHRARQSNFKSSQFLGQQDIAKLLNKSNP